MNATKIKYQANCFFILILGIIIRLIFFLSYPVQPRDSFYYSTISLNNKTSDNLISPLAAKIFESYGTDFFEKGLVVNMLLGVAIIGEVMIIAKLLLKSAICSEIAGIFAATNNSLIVYSTQITRENFLISAEALSIIFLCLYFLKKYNILFFALGFVTLGIGTMCRYEAMELFIFILLFMFFYNLVKKEKTTVLLNKLFVALFSYSITIVTICYFLKIDLNYFLKYANERFIKI